MPGPDVLTRPARRPDLVLRYADHAEGVVDVHVPPGSPEGRPLLVLLHGGFWRAAWDRRHTHPMAEALAAAGFVVATPEYRRVGAGGGYPVTTDDAQLALRLIPELLGQSRHGLVDPAVPLTLVGHSAGGHLALWLATRTGLPPVGRVVALAPVADLVDAFERDLDGGAVAAFMGGSPDRVDYRPADPSRLLADAPDRPRLVVLHGDRDRQVPLEHSRWARQARDVTLHVLRGADHFALIDPVSAAWPEVLAAVAER